VSTTTSAAGDPPPLPAPDIPDDPVARWPSLKPINARVPLGQYLVGIWERRSFLVAMPFGELRARHQDTLLGQLWHLINPLLLTAVYWLVFGQFADRGGSAYLAFLVAGIIPYQFTQKAVTQGARLIHANRNLIQSVHFPRGILPLSAVLGEFIAHLTALVVMLGVIVLTGSPLTWWWLLIVPITLVQVVFNLGLAFFASRMTFHFRDIENILPYILRLLFYMSGIIFSVEQMAGDRAWLRDVLHANPINGLVRLVRMATMDGTTDASVWLLVLGWTAGLFVLGFIFFRAAETEYGRV
jgi:teichoic acid transport system permease protein